MKKFLNLLLIGIFIFTISGCSLSNKSAKGAVENFLNQYKSLDQSVLSDLDSIVDSENFTDSQKEKYKNIMKRQYQDLKYEVTSEEYDGDTAVVETKISVYDIYKVQKEANEYLIANEEEFRDDSGIYSNELFLDFKLDMLENVEDRVDYTIKFDLKKDEDGKYKVINISEEMLEKIHGIYNYETH